MERRSGMPVLAGDVGGTKSLLALVETEGEGLRIQAEKRFESPSYSGLAPIVQAFLEDTGARVDAACFGVPGAVIDGTCRTPNLPWVIREADIAEATGVSRVRLINDFAAAALGVLALQPADLATLQAGQPVRNGIRAVLGAGTGLGEALLVHDGSRYLVVPTEGGHADFAPRGELQRALAADLEEIEGGHVSVERVVSGAGLRHIYGFLVERGVPTSSEARAAMHEDDPAAVISRLAMAGTDEACVEALDLFVAVYGAEAGNLALRSLPGGGLYVAGGIAPKILAKLQDGSFLRAFHDKGRLSQVMESFPVHVVLDPNVGLLGAALSAAGLGD
jgi:glucokinase